MKERARCSRQQSFTTRTLAMDSGLCLNRNKRDDYGHSSTQSISTDEHEDVAGLAPLRHSLRTRPHRPALAGYCEGRSRSWRQSQRPHRGRYRGSRRFILRRAVNRGHQFRCRISWIIGSRHLRAGSCGWGWCAGYRSFRVRGASYRSCRRRSPGVWMEGLVFCWGIESDTRQRALRARRSRI